MLLDIVNFLHIYSISVSIGIIYTHTFIQQNSRLPEENKSHRELAT